MRYYRRIRPTWPVLIVLAVGCSRGTSDYVSVTGTVTIDGKPADGVRVDFLPANESDSSVRDRYASGYTDKAGRFEVRSVSGQGIPPGEYKVTFSRMLAHGKGVDPKKKTSNTRESLPDKYLTKEKTDQTAQVTKDKTDFVFDLSSRLK